MSRRTDQGQAAERRRRPAARRQGGLQREAQGREGRRTRGGPPPPTDDIPQRHQHTPPGDGRGVVLIGNLRLGLTGVNGWVHSWANRITKITARVACPATNCGNPFGSGCLTERLWARRPGALATVSVVAGGGLLAVRHLAVAHSPSACRRAGCGRGHPAGRGTDDPSTTHAGQRQPRTPPAGRGCDRRNRSGGRGSAGRRITRQEASIIMATHRPLKAAPIADVTGAESGRTAARASRSGPQAVRRLFPGHAHRRRSPRRRPEDRHPARRHGHQPAPDPEGDQGTSGRHQLRLCALWREPAGAGQQGARQGSRGHAAAADRTAGLSGQSIPARRHCCPMRRRKRTSSRCAGCSAALPASPASPTTWAAGSWPYPTVWHR